MKKVSRKQYGMLINSLLLAVSLCITGCGVKMPENGGDGTHEGESVVYSSEDAGGQSEATDKGGTSLGNGTENDFPSNGIIETLGENDIAIGIIRNAHGWKSIKEDADAFNAAQSEYKAVVVEYETYDSMMMDVVRRQGADIFSLWGMPVEMLAEKGVLENLAPYFEGSEEVSVEDLATAVSRACTMDGKLMCMIPSFAFQAILAPKGVTDNGKWTLEEYVAFAEANPGGMLHEKVKQPADSFFNDLALAPESYVNWEEGSCSFDSDDFVTLLQKLKKFSNANYNISSEGTLAERLHRREYLTLQVSIYMDSRMDSYLNIKDVSGNEYEIVGYPGDDNTLQYHMLYDKMYGMNAASEKKEGAWAFLEYLLSGEVQGELAKTEFPARQDVLEAVIQEAIDFEPPENYRGSTHNVYTGEKIKGYRPFTEEDGQAVLEMVEHVYRFSVMGADISYILLEEVKYYFDGDKSAKEVAGLIQNRIQLYLDENS